MILAILAQPGQELPSRIALRPGDRIVTNVTTTFTGPDLTLVLEDRVTSVVSAVSQVAGAKETRITFKHQVVPLRETLDGVARQFPPDAPGYPAEEIRTERNFQFRWSADISDPDETILLSRFLTLPLPLRRAAKGERWEVSDSRHLPYRFTGTHHGLNNGRILVHGVWAGTKGQEWSARGWAQVDAATGWPMRMNVTANRVRIPGSEEDPLTAQVISEVTSFPRR